MTNAPVDPRLVEFVRQRRQKATAQPVNPKMVDFVRQRRAAMSPPVNVVGMPVLPGDADYERVQHENRVYQNTKEYGDPFEGSPGMIAKRFGQVVATGGKGVLPAAYDSTIGATARGLGRVAASVAEGTGLASKERADQTRAVMDTYAQNEARTAAQTPGGSVGSFVGPAALSAGMMLATRTPYAGALTGTGLGIYGLSSADQGMAEYRATRQQQGKDANPWEELAVGAGYGAAEILFERIGLNKTGAAIRSVGQNMADAVLRRDAKALAQIAMSTAESVGVNMTEEGATQYAQNIIDSTFDPNQDINEGVRSSMIGGGLQGLMFAGPGGALSGAYHGVRAARDAGRTAAAYGGAVVDAIRGPQADATQTPPAPVNSPTAQAAAERLRRSQQPGSVSAATRDGVTTNEEGYQEGRQEGLLNEPAAAGAQQAPATGPLVPPGQQPSEQDLADARAIIMRDPQIVTQPSRFRAEYLAARKRRAQPARPFAYTDNPDLATVLGADQIGLTNIRTRRGDANAAQRAESGGGAPGAVAVRGSDVSAAPAPAVQDRAVPPSDQGRGVEGAAVEPAPTAPVGDGVGEVVGDQRAEVRNQPGDVGGVAPAQKQPWEMTYTELSQAIDPFDKETLQAARPLLAQVFPEYVGTPRPGEPDPWNIGRAIERGDELPRVPKVDLSSRHRKLIARAVSEGKPVPAEVLADYPDLGGTTRTSINEKATDQGLAQTPNASLEPDQRDGGRDGGAENVPKFPGTIKATMPSREETVRVVQAFFRIRHEQRGKSSPFRKVDPSVVVSGDDSWTKYARGGESIILDWPNVHIPEDAADAWNRAVYASGVSDLRVSSSSQQTTKSPTPQPPSAPDPATLPRPKLVRLAKERGVDTKGTKKEIAERVKAETSPDPAAKYQPRTRPWLSREAKRRGMNGSGTKDDLIAMLVASDQQRATVQQGATDGGTDTTPVGQVAGADQRGPGVRQGNKARNGAGSKGSQRGKGEAYRGEYSKSDIQRRLTQAVESSGYPIDDIETEAFRAEELGMPEFSTSFAGNKLPGEIRDWLDGRGIAYRSLFTTGSSKMRGTGEDSFAALGADRYFELVEQLYSKARNIDKAARSLAKSGGYPDVSFFLWLSDRLPERQAERGPFEIVEASTIGDGQVVKILGTYFEGVKDPKWGGIQIIERGDGGEVIDRRALVIEPTLTTRIPIDAGSLSTAEQEFGPRESGTDDAPPAKRSDERGVFGQQAEGITGAQIGMFSGTRDVKGEKQQTARWQEGDAFSIRNERFRVVRVEKDPQTPNNPGDDWITYEEVDRRGKGSGKYREISHNDLRRHWQVEPPTDRTADREAARRAMSDSEAQERYPGIRRGESVAKYEKRMGTTDTAAMFDAIADRAKERLEKRAKKQRGSKTLNSGLNPEQVATALRDTVDLSIVGAARGLAAGVRAGRALTKIVDAAIAEMGRTVTPKVRAIIQKNVRKILAESGGDPDKFEKVVSDLYNAPVTKKDIRAQAKARKQAAASITNPGENAAPVSQADALRGRLKAAEQTGEKVAKSAAAKIVQATRQGYQRGRRDERRTAIANMQGVVNDIKRERGRLRSLAQFEKRAGEVAVKMTADDARRAQMIRDGIRQQVVQYARTLPKSVRGAVVGAISNADSPVRMVRAVRMLQRELYRHDGREAWGWIKKNARSSAVDKLKGVTNDLRKSVADLYAKAASAKRRIDAAETLKDSSIALAELQNLQAEIGLHITTARAAFKAIKGQRQQSAFQIATNAADIIAKRFAKRSGDGVSQIRDPKRWWIRKHLDSYSDLRNMLATLEGDNGPLFSAIWEALEEGSAEYSSLRRDKRAAMERAYVRAGFKDMADAIDSLSAFAGRGVEKKYTVTVGGESKTLSLGEISSLIAHNSDPETAALIASEHGMRFKSPEGTGNEGVIPTPNEIKDMAAAIEKDYKLAQLIDDLKAINEKDADRTLREVGELTGVQPKKVEKRWTRSRDMEMVPGMEDKPITTADPSMVNVIRSFAENMGIYEHRTQTTGIPILLKDVHSVMEEEIHKQAATLALARRVRDAMLILTQDQLGKAIINAKGVEFYRALKRQVMAAGRTEVVYATQAEKAVGFLKGSAAVKYLAANPSTYIGNLLGTLRVLPDVDARYYAAGIAAMWSMSRAELEAKSGYLWDRWEQQGMGRFGPSHEATMDARLTQAHTGFRSFLREIGRQVRNSMKNAGRLDLGAGLTNLRLGSAAFMQGLNWVESRIAAFTWGAMDAKIRSELPELSAKAREKVVEKFVRREIRETQNGGDPVDAATIATQNRSSAASMVMFLLSDVMKVRNRVKRAFRQSKTYGSKVLAAEAVGALAKAYAVKYLWDSIDFGIAGALGDDDDKERIVARMNDWTKPLERASQDLFQIVMPIGGPDLMSLVDAVRGRYTEQARGGPVAMVAPLYDAGSAGLNAISVIAKSIENDDMNAEKIGLALAKFFDETASAFGLNPLSPWTRRVLREIVQTRKSEWW